MSADPAPDPMPVQGFPPIAAPDARVLILGSMPGAASLAAARYYAHPRNAFWPMIESLLGCDPAVSADPADPANPADRYARRVAMLKDARIALWDVLHRCVRPGSLDAAIDARSIEINDFAGFFAAHPGIVLIGFNGATAEREYLRRVRPGLPARFADIARCRLPSTSPAMASLGVEAKRAAWTEALSAQVHDAGLR